MVDAIVLLGQPTSAFVRVSTVASNIDKTKLIDFFKFRGINLVYGVTADDPPALKVGYNLAVARFVKGQTKIDIDLAFGMEASEFYSEADFASIDEPLDCCQWSFCC